jgi:hypothetical protein
VRRLIQQVHGTSTVNSDHGTVWNVKFPIVSTIPVPSAVA